MTINQIQHDQNQKIIESRIYAWMQRNWQRHTDDGELNAESLAEQAAWEYGCSGEVATRLAKEFKKSIEEGTTDA